MLKKVSAMLLSVMLLVSFVACTSGGIKRDDNGVPNSYMEYYDELDSDIKELFDMDSSEIAEKYDVSDDQIQKKLDEDLTLTLLKIAESEKYPSMGVIIYFADGSGEKVSSVLVNFDLPEEEKAIDYINTVFTETMSSGTAWDLYNKKAIDDEKEQEYVKEQLEIFENAFESNKNPTNITFYGQVKTEDDLVVNTSIYGTTTFSVQIYNADLDLADVDAENAEDRYEE